MTIGFILPTLLGVAVITAMGRVDWHLRPQTAIRLFTGAMVLAATSVVLVVGGTALAFVLGPARATTVTNWCRSIPLHHDVGPALGFISLGLSLAMAVRCGRIVFARRRAISAVRRSGRVAIIDSTDRFAYAVPTRSGCVVVSTGLLHPLSPEERRVVFAHERAHLRLGHHRYLFAAETCRAILPFLGPLVAQIQHATERAADEAAVSAVRCDRRVVASAIATAALGERVPATLPSLGGGSVSRRVEALLWPDRETVAGRLVSTIALGAGATAAIALTIQLHHFSTLIDHLCRSTL